MSSRDMPERTKKANLVQILTANLARLEANLVYQQGNLAQQQANLAILVNLT